MNRVVRFFIPASVLCLCASLVTWLAVEPEHQLVGLRPQPPRQHEFPWLERENLDITRYTLESTAIWGVQRNGQPPPPPSAPSPENVMLAWKVVAMILRKQERYLLVQIEGKPPLQIKEGEDLPDGSTLLKLLANGYQIRTPEGNKETILTSP